MSNPWFRMYSEFAHDPKVQMLGEEMQRRYVMLMCLRCGNNLVTLHETEIAFALRINNDDLASTKALFVEKGFIDSEWNLLNWEKRQFASDSSAARVAEHRKRKKEAESEASNCGVTLPKRKSNALDTDKNKDIKTRAKRNPSKTALPENFGVSDSVAKWAMQHGHTHLAERLEHFICSAKAKGYTYADWDQALMNAIRNDWAKLSSAPGRPSVDDRLGGAL